MCACLVTGYAGPFGSVELLPVAPRVMYLFVLLGFATVTQTYLSFLTYRALTLDRGMHFLGSAIIAGLVGRLVIASIVVLHYRTFIPHGPAVDFSKVILDVGVPVVILTLLGNLFTKLPNGYIDPRAPASHEHRERREQRRRRRARPQ